MLKSGIAAGAIVLAAFAVTPATSAQAPEVVRKVLMQHDLPSDNMSETLVQVDFPAGSREGKHIHSGPLMAYVSEGSIALDYEGQPTKTYKAGDVFYVDAGKIHEGINMGNAPARVLATLVTPKGQPLTTQK